MLPDSLRLGAIDLLVCPLCGRHPLAREGFAFTGPEELETGVLWCPPCRRWFPIEGGVLELLSPAFAYAEDRDRFWTSHEARLRHLGLDRGGPGPAGRHDAAVRQQQTHFDWYADNSQQSYTAYEATPFWRAADAIAFEAWRQDVRPGSRLLDIACAQGRSTFHWTDLDLEIVAFDISKALIRQANERLRQARPRARATFFVAEATRFPLVSSAFDYALAYGVLHHLPDPAQACREIIRVLRPGGLFFGSENNRTIFRAAFDLLQRLWPLWHEQAGEHALISEGDLRRWLEPAGCDISVRTSVFLPPHLVNRFGRSRAERLLRVTDRAARVVPWLRDQGGLILVRGQTRG